MTVDNQPKELTAAQIDFNKRTIARAAAVAGPQTGDPNNEEDAEQALLETTHSFDNDLEYIED